jgi:hypothetical protein
MTLCGVQYVEGVVRKLLCDCSFAYFKQNTDLYLLPAVTKGEYFSLLCEKFAKLKESAIITVFGYSLWRHGNKLHVTFPPHQSSL